MPDQGRIDPIRRRDGLAGELHGLDPLLLLERGVEGFDLHAVFHQRDRSGFASTGAPGFPEGFDPLLLGLFRPRLDVLRPDDLRVQTSGRSPQLAPEPTRLDLLLQRLPESADRRNIAAGIPWRVCAEPDEVRPRDLDGPVSVRRDADLVRAVWRDLLRVRDPIRRDDPELLPAVAVRIRQRQDIDAAEELQLCHESEHELKLRLILVRLPEQLRRHAVAVALALVVFVPGVDLERQLCDRAGDEIDDRREIVL